MTPENLLFEYATIRVVPHVEREEFINVGVILFCQKQKFLQTRIRINEQRIQALSPGLDLDDVKKHVSSFERICRGGADGGPIGKLSPAERFRWLTAARSTILQTSHVHPGLTKDPDQMLEKLFSEMVL